jgi:hypothetical protein
MNAPTDTYVVQRPFRFDGVEYARGDRFRPDLADAKVAHKVGGLQGRGMLDIWTRTRRRETTND